jgi:hypothetical protein
MRDDKVTPGPWHVHEGGNFVRVAADGYEEFVERESYLGGPLCIANVAYGQADDVWTEEGHRHALTNARLISAAPELLAALKTVADDVCGMACPSVWKTGQRPPHSNKCEQVRAAIAKAEGR